MDSPATSSTSVAYFAAPSASVARTEESVWKSTATSQALLHRGSQGTDPPARVSAHRLAIGGFGFSQVRPAPGLQTQACRKSSLRLRARSMTCICASIFPRCVPRHPDRGGGSGGLGGADDDLLDEVHSSNTNQRGEPRGGCELPSDPLNGLGVHRPRPEERPEGVKGQRGCRTRR
ncbi:MAG: hypothetical protein MZV63_14200 [Marinilabiliales bacterium]|nr:hypothetical protein [Marinilabiliales bacterium]